MKIPIQQIKQAVFFLAGGIFGFVLLVLFSLIGFQNRILPGVSVAGVDIGGMPRERAQETLSKAFSDYSLTVLYNEHEWEIPAEAFGFEASESTRQAYSVGREARKVFPYIASIPNGYDSPAVLSPDFSDITASVSSAVSIPASSAILEVQGSTISIIQGEDGLEVDEEAFQEALVSRARDLSDEGVEVPFSHVSLSLSEEEQEQLIQRAQSLLTDTLTLTVDDQSFSLRGEIIIGFLETRPDTGFGFSREKILSYTNGLSETVNRPAQDARFQMTDDGRVQEFSPAQDGLELQIEETAGRIEKALSSLVGDTTSESVVLAVSKTAPKVDTEDVNDLGIVERLGSGESYYRGSIAPRVHNVEHTARKLDGVLIPPGEEFSFNGAVGDISAATGFQSAYIIQDGRTVLGDGGGVCQDSTTIFRAAMDAGLPITERWAHSYRVGYYEQNAKPGFDATVYAPSKDLRFLNDTPAHILIDTTYNSATRYLRIDIYGTSDGRQSYVSPARVWDVTPPPPPLYQDDPSLPAGQVKQVDWQAWGAKSSFDYSVKRNGETVFSKTYFSSYRPWQDVFLRGVGGE